MTNTPNEAVPTEEKANDTDGFPETLPEVPYGDETPAKGEPK